MKKIDLHVHTKFSSDADFSPEKIIDWALKKRLGTIAITDHDTLEGLEVALEYAKNKKINIIPGVEISCIESSGPAKIHIIGLFIDYKNESLKKFLTKSPNPMMKVIKAIKDVGGIAVLAHPGIYLIDLDNIVKKFVEYGGK